MVKVSGVVIKGKQIGRNLGFPTANIVLKKPLESGIYAGEVLYKDKKYRSAIFIPEAGDVLEAHLLNFSGNLYGQSIEVEVGEKIRDILKFNVDVKLIEQIKKDINIIRNL
jgi:riboflavin kinase/FMN adenylyltransferase